MVFFSSVLAKAEEVSEEKKDKTFSVSGEIGIFSSYVNDNTGEYTNGITTRPGLMLTHNPTGFYVGALGYISERGVDEVDIYLGKTTELGEFKFDTGIGIYDVDRLTDIDGDFFIAYVGVDFPETAGIIPFVYLETDIPFREEFGKGGTLWKFGAKKSLEISKQPIDLKLEFGGSDGIYDTTPMTIAFARGIVSTKVNLLGLELVPSLSIQKGFGGIAETEWRAIAGFTVAF
jgi:hypothetical protein